MDTMPKRYFLFLNTKYNWIWIYIPFISASRMNLLIILLSFFNTTSHAVLLHKLVFQQQRSLK